MKPVVSLLRTYLAKCASSALSTAGFTMIELLVVISVIGVLAVAVLSSINPIEQINKGRDTRTRSDAAQLINAVDRYYAIHEVYPWNVTNGAYTTADVDPAAAFEEDGTGTPLLWTQILEDTAEVKQGFINRITVDNEIRIFKALGANETMYACFEPTSQAFQQEAADNCNDGTTPPDGSANVDPCPTDTASVITDNVTDPEFICLP